MLTYRLKNIKYAYLNSFNYKLRERLVFETNSISERVTEINKIGELLNKGKNDEMNFSCLLIENCKRALIHTQLQKNLFSF